ncbi:U3 snoRNP protein [Marasmius crinis-equi]|uniref:U3 snoRNP protein n=1 Tax=Marasmius crinis-equi TaxID=585013 RepID=A0ABR3F8P2_9AGAR
MTEAQATQEASIPQLSTLAQLIDAKPECLGTGDNELKNAALAATKFIFDLSVQSEGNAKEHLEPLLNSFQPSQAPQTRSQTRKRKRSPSPAPQITFETTPLSSLFVDGMAEDQVWSQLELKMKNMCNILDFTFEAEQPDSGDEGLKMGGPDEDDDEEDDELDEETEARLVDALQRMQNGEDVDFAALGLEDALTKYLSQDSDDEEDDSEEEDDEYDEEAEEEEEVEGEEYEGVALRDPSDEEDEDEDGEPTSMMDIISRLTRPSGKKGKTKSAAHDELDDGFFDLDAFNAETERAEAKKSSSGRLRDDEDGSSDEEGSIDLFAPVEDVEAFEEEDLEHDGSNIYYKDFFKAPTKGKKAAIKPPEPPKKAGSVRFHDEVRVKKIKATGKNRPTNSTFLADDGDEDEDEDDDDDDEEAGFSFSDLGGGDMEEDGFGDFEEEEEDGGAFGDLGNDEEEDDDEQDDEEDEDEDDDEAANPRDTIERLKDDLFAEEEPDQQKDMSAHEKRMAALKDQITELEAENVGERDWQLMGEAGSRSRPQNSLLEEDLEFERVQKPVPVITEEVVQGLEERIKARIREGRFDDVVRLRPVDDKPFLPSRLFELNDSKSKQSLAQIYEDDYVAAQTGGVAGEDRDGKLQKEHDEIEKLWEGICGKLDALCNAHYTPKQPKATISTVANVSTASMESALPTTQSASTMLAPEEVFAPAASDLRAKSEMTSAEKQALRRKQRKDRKKSRDLLDKNVDKYAKAKKGGSVKKQKEEALKSVVKAGKGVTVIGKKSKDLAKGKKGKT